MQLMKDKYYNLADLGSSPETYSQQYSNFQLVGFGFNYNNTLYSKILKKCLRTVTFKLVIYS